MSGIHVESVSNDDEKVWEFIVHEAARGRDDGRDNRNDVGTMMWRQRIGSREKVKNRGPGDLRT
jgi:hypothetical protein